MENEKLKSLDTAISSLEKAYGKGTIMRMGQAINTNVEAIPTGSMLLDYAIGIGGLPKGRIVEIFGPESSGKTTLALSVVAQAQKLGGTALYIDVEHALDPVYARGIGVDIDNLLISQPDSGEQAMEICDTMVRSGAISVVVIDSVAAMVTKAEIEGTMSDSHVGQQARLMSLSLKKITASIAKSNTLVIFVNQLRDKIGVMYGNPETTPGGRALKFFASVRLDVRKKETLKQDGEFYANHVLVKVVKNKVAPPFREAEFDIIFGKGISRDGEVVDMAVKFDIINKSGSWFSYNGDRIAQGRDNTCAYLNAHPELFAEVENKVKEHLVNSSVTSNDATAKDFNDLPQANEIPVVKKRPGSRVSADIEVE